MEDEFTSGPWTGFYLYANGAKEPMSLHLSFRNGLVDGSGSDPVGDFGVRGRYDAAAGDVWWTKTYAGRHSVYYKGCRDARGIWGTWEISASWRGGFHIWPEGRGAGAAEHAEAEVPAGPAGRRAVLDFRGLSATIGSLMKPFAARYFEYWYWPR